MAREAPGTWNLQPEQGCLVGWRGAVHMHVCSVPVVLCFLVVCGVLWWLYYDYTNDLSTELDTERENMKCLLGFAIVSTVITVRNALPAADESRLPEL